MDKFIKLTPQERQIYFEGTANARNMQGAIIEKDFWVCWVLKELFSMREFKNQLIFKGGTSLSKAYKVIERFSEDIDISINRDFLGFDGEKAPDPSKSGKQNQKSVEGLKAACQLKIVNELLPTLSSKIKAKIPLKEKWGLNLDLDDPDQQILLFEYPTCFDVDLSGYIRRVVKIEMGARSDSWPAEIKEIKPYVAEQFPRGFEVTGCSVNVLSAERTFWEKATILHAEFNRPAERKTPDRYSRHYYDFYQLIGAGVSKIAERDLKLLARVVEHKSIFFKSSWANFHEATKGKIRVSPPEFRQKDLKSDYNKMQQMFFGKSPTFEQIIEVLQRWEEEFNQG